MGSLDEARGASTAYGQQAEQCIGQLQAAGQQISEAQQAFRGRLGNTSHPKVGEVDARSQEAKQRVHDAIQALNAAREAANQFAAGLS